MIFKVTFKVGKNATKSYQIKNETSDGALKKAIRKLRKDGLWSLGVLSIEEESEG
jgi:hypothetical protein